METTEEGGLRPPTGGGRRPEHPIVPLAAADGARAAGAPSMARALLVSLRPQQWTKNLALAAALVFARQATVPGQALRVAAAVLLFCAVAGAVYLINDLEDRARDRLHPLKRLRPIASGALGERTAWLAASVLLAGAFAGAWFLDRGFLQWCAAYVLLQVAYSRLLKHIVILDVFAVAAGFVLRVVAGAQVIHVPISNWLYLCTLLLALFLALSKRRHEVTLVEAGEAGAGHREALAHYSVPLLDQMITVVAGATVVAYSLYTMSDRTVGEFGTDALKYTIPFVLYGLLRYLYLVHRHEGGGSPERHLYTDPGILAAVALFALVAALVIYVR
jgi:4-hydroxybenzoate polyprenyltransferase